MKHIWDIIKGFIGSAMVLLLAYINLDYFPVLSGFNFQVRLNLISLILSFLALAFLITLLFIKRRPLFIKNGRIGAMEGNLRLLMTRPPRNRLKRYILSTRVSFWPVEENESTRTKFRDELTEKIRTGYSVKRIWQIHDLDDIERLNSYLQLYQQYDNYNVKCFVGTTAFIPEILSVFGKVVSVSIPQEEDPRKVTTAFHFRGKREIIRWESYFNILWETSLPIKSGNTIYYDNIDIVRNKLTGGVNSNE